MEQTIGEVWKDGHGLDAIEWTKMEQKKRKVCGSTFIGACVPDQLSVESAESTPIARWPRSVSMGMAGSGTVRPSPCAALLPRASPLTKMHDQARCTNILYIYEAPDSYGILNGSIPYCRNYGTII